MKPKSVQSRSRINEKRVPEPPRDLLGIFKRLWSPKCRNKFAVNFGEEVPERFLTLATGPSPAGWRFWVPPWEAKIVPNGSREVLFQKICVVLTKHTAEAANAVIYILRRLKIRDFSCPGEASNTGPVDRIWGSRSANTGPVDKNRVQERN